MKIIPIIIAVMISVSFTPTLFVTAQQPSPVQPANPQPSPVQPANPQPSPVQSSSGGGAKSLTNPLNGINSLEDLLVTILRIVIVLATPIVVLFIILAGFKYVTARGDATKTKEATLALTYAVIGGVLIIGAVAIAEIIGNLVEAFE